MNSDKHTTKNRIAKMLKQFVPFLVISLVISLLNIVSTISLSIGGGSIPESLANDTTLRRASLEDNRLPISIDKKNQTSVWFSLNKFHVRKVSLINNLDCAYLQSETSLNYTFGDSVQTHSDYSLIGLCNSQTGYDSFPLGYTLLAGDYKGEEFDSSVYSTDENSCYLTKGIAEELLETEHLNNYNDLIDKKIIFENGKNAKIVGVVDVDGLPSRSRSIISSFLFLELFQENNNRLVFKLKQTYNDNFAIFEYLLRYFVVNENSPVIINFYENAWMQQHLENMINSSRVNLVLPTILSLIFGVCGLVFSVYIRRFGRSTKQRCIIISLILIVFFIFSIYVVNVFNGLIIGKAIVNTHFSLSYIYTAVDLAIFIVGYIIGDTFLIRKKKDSIKSNEDDEYYSINV